MKTIWKVQLKGFTGVMEIQLPEHAKMLSVHNQFDELILYAEVDVGKPLTKRTICIVETGKEIPIGAQTKPRHYIGTVILFNGAYVNHVYEIKE